MPHRLAANLRAPRPGRPLIIAHRGGSLEAPENTLAALRHGIEVGSDWQEVDVALTADSEVVIIHDDTLDRTTSGVGMVAQHTLEQLALLTAGAPAWSTESMSMLQAMGIGDLPQFEDSYALERVPKLSDALVLPKARLMIEMKTVARPQALAEAVITAVVEAKMEDRVILASFDPAALAAAERVATELALMGLAENEAGLAPLEALNLAAIGVQTEMTQAAIKWTRGRMPVWAWTLYTETAASKLVAMGVEGLITDIPKKLVASFGR